MKFEFEFNIEDGNTALPSFDIIENKIQLILNRRFGSNTPRSHIKHAEGKLNFACPYCGDSHNNPNAKRGNVFFSNMWYKCFNCEVTRPVMTLLKDWIELTPEDILTVGMLAKDSNKINTDRYYDNFINKDKYEKYLVSREEFKRKKNLVEITDDFKLKKYLDGRDQTKFEYFLGDSKTKQIYIMNLADNDKLLSYTIRNTYGNVRYNINTVNDLYFDVGRTTPPADDIDFKYFDRFSQVFDIFNVDFNDTVTILEGQFDSLLFPNSISVNGATKKLPITIENSRYILDNDKTGFKKSLNLLKDGVTVFMWSKFLKDFNITANIKDYNDLYTYNKKKKFGIKMSDINGYFTSDKFDIMCL